MVPEKDSNDGENRKPDITAYIPHKDSNGRTPEERLARLQNSDEMIRLSKAERDAEERKKADERETADRRSALLNAVRVSTPDLSTKLFEEMKELASRDRNFSSRDAIALMNATGVTLNPLHDFYDLNTAQRNDLLDRIGFYRGVVIDQNSANTVESGFREVLKRPDDLSPVADEDRESVPATLFYRRPNLSGYFENNHTSNESVHQMQKNGVTNLSLSLNVAMGAIKSAAVGSEYGSASQSRVTSGGINRTQYTTASFYLPMIELSFDDSEVCASHAFIRACRAALRMSVPDSSESAKDEVLTGTDADLMDRKADEALEARFRRLKKVLDTFGHFVPVNTRVGGRLYATEEKQLTTEEQTTDLTERFAVAVKASFSHPVASGDAGFKYEKSAQMSASDETAMEAQRIIFQAVGGEGSTVQNASLWADSLADYRRWSAIQRENLVPTVSLLPDALRDEAWSVLEKFSRASDKRSLLNEEDASFLFFGEYAKRAGSKAREIYFGIQSLAKPAAVSLGLTPPRQGDAALLSHPSLSQVQMWHLTAEGQIISYLKVKPGATGRREDIAFALTAGPLKKDSGYEVLVKKAGSSPLQQWQCTEAGEIINTALSDTENRFVLTADSSEKLILTKQKPGSDLTQLWTLQEFSEKEVTAARPPVIAESRVRFTGRDKMLALSVLEGANQKELIDGKRYTVCGQPYRGELHQLWQKDAVGNIISCLKTATGKDIYLSSTDIAESPYLTATTYDALLTQRWKNDVNHHLMPASGPLADKMMSLSLPFDQSQPVFLSEQKPDTHTAWEIEEISENQVVSDAGYYMLTGQAFAGKEEVFTVDSRELVINGYIREISLYAVDRKMFNVGGLGFGEGWALQMRLKTQRAAGGEENIQHLGAPDNDNQLFKDLSPVYVETAMVYLPDWPIYSLRLSIRPGVKNVLCFEYKSRKESDWIGAHSDTSTLRLWKPGYVSVGKEIMRSSGSAIVGLGLDYNETEARIAPKLLLKK
ncbi:MAC/perforin domain-containing protein [Cedecea colo]|uniref:MACPF-like domain-containing protein n=1 Tax=Cedecea colo TaxID=2552946 RepID=A0ABX0VHH0_9ENTR|nr:MAC/perforin domain-containing protein [Cedecea colo]NIY46520.1 hypothetical protein [Cedecea colo]